MEKVYKNPVIILLLILGAVYFFMKNIVPLVSPALVGIVFLSVMGQFMQGLMEKYGIKRQYSVLIFLVLFYSLLLGGIWLGSRIVGKNLGEWIREIETVIKLPDTLKMGINEKLFDLAYSAANYSKSIAGLGMYLIVFTVTVWFLAKDYDKIMGYFIENSRLQLGMEVFITVVKYVGCYLRTQATIMGIQAMFIGLALSILKVKLGFVFGIIAGILDALPFIGTGFVLLPVAISYFFKEKYLVTVGCGIIYVICILIRNYLEPKLIGRRMGVHPGALLVTIYGGIKLFGPVGIIKGPLSLIIVQEIWRSLKRRDIIK